MYRFCIYNIDRVAENSSPPGRTNDFGRSLPTFEGAWAAGLEWAAEQVKALSEGSYVCIATEEGNLQVQGVWAFTVEEAASVVVYAVDFRGASVKAGV